MTKKIIAHVTDTHLGQKLVMGGDPADGAMRYDHEPAEHKDHLRLVLDDIARKGVSDVVFGGDIGARDSVGEFFEILKDHDFALSVVLGNHDTCGVVAQYCGVGLGAVEDKLCSSIRDGYFKLIFLHSSAGTIGDRQLTWLSRELEGMRAVVLFLHHPILRIDTPLERSGTALRDRDAVKTLLTSTDCDVFVVCGHYHMIDEAREANIRQFVTPAASYQIVKRADRIRVDTKTIGYRILEIDGPEIRTEAVLLTTS